MRSRFRRSHERTFRVELIVHQLDSIPAIHRFLYVQWRARRAQPSDGRTPAQPVEAGNVVRWNCTQSFNITIPAESTDPTVLQPAPLVLDLRSERRGRWVSTSSYRAEGRVDLDLSQIAAVGSIARNFLVQESLLNTTLKLTVRVTHQAGDKIFRTRTLPQINTAGLPPLPTNSSASTPPGTSSNEFAPFPVQDEDPSVSQAESVSVNPLRDLSLLPLSKLDSSDGANTLPGASQDRVASSSLPNPPNTHAQNAPRNSASSLPMLAGNSNPSNSSSLFQPLENHVSPSHFADITEDSATSVLHDGIPNPEVTQQHIYEEIFQKRMRDSWPCYVVNSRVDAVKTVNDVYASVCAADGIGVTTPTSDLVSRPDGNSVDSTQKCLDHVNGTTPSGSEAEARLKRVSPHGRPIRAEE